MVSQEKPRSRVKAYPLELCLRYALRLPHLAAACCFQPSEPEHSDKETCPAEGYLQGPALNYLCTPAEF